MKHKWAAPATIAGVVIIVGAIILSPSDHARALTGGDVVDKFSSDEQYSYYSGAVGIASLLSWTAGNKKRADCINNWFFKEKGWRHLDQALKRYKDRQAPAVIYAVIQKKCGK